MKTINQQFKWATMAASVALALGMSASAYAVQGVHFDPDGSAADGSPSGAGESIVSAFDWGPGHVLYSNCFGSLGLGATSGCTIRAQGSISSVTGLASIPAGVSYSFTLQKGATSVAKPGYTGVFSDGGDLNITNNTSDLGSFKIYVDKSGVPVDPLAGTGYDTVHTILVGTVKVSTFGLSNSGSVTENLDQFTADGDNWPGLQTYITSGSPKFDIEVTSIDTNYFKDPITLFTVTFSPDLKGADGSSSPFDNIDPSHQVGGVLGQAFTGAADTSAGGVGTDGSNDIYCGKAQSCSGEFQGDAISTFQTQVSAPEPGILALLGIGLVGLGVTTRKSGFGRKGGAT